VEVPLLLQFSIALLTGMVAATFVPPVRRAIPRLVEVLLWIGFISVSVLGVASITDRNARELSTSAVWGADQIFNTTVGLMIGGASSWVYGHKFPITSWLVIIAGADLLLLVLIRSARSARHSQPRVRLREWMEIPVAAQPRGTSVVDPLAGVNRRMAAWGAIAATTVLASLVEVSIWVRDVMVPRQARRLARAAVAGRVESRARLESLRDATAHLKYAARSWYSAAGEPVISGLATRTARVARRGLKPIALRPGEIVDIQALLSAQSIGWYGPFNSEPMPSPGDNDAAESQRSDRLAS
jgi:hypothetical protein